MREIMKDKIYNVDCLRGFEMISDNSFDHVLTSPPYNRKRNDKYSFYNDDKANYKTFICEVIKQSLRVSSGYVFLNIQKNYYNKREVFELIGEFANQIVDILIWNKSNPMPSPGTQVTNAYEFIIVLSKSKTSLRANGTYTKNAFTTNVYSNNPYTNIHKAVMHPEACDYILQNFVKKGEYVLDPFMGLATTAVCCLRHGVSFAGFEIDEMYYKEANERIKLYKGGA